ncbi:MAG: hypothetical protein ACKVX7_05390 [Planctomycetota bacterium]
MAHKNIDLLEACIVAHDRAEGNDGLDTWVARSNLGVFYRLPGAIAKKGPR